MAPRMLDLPLGGSLPEGWYVKESTSHPGHVYFYHPESGKVQWKSPPPSEVRCYHVLLKHTGSRKPFSKARNAMATRTPEEAKAGIISIIAELKAGAGEGGDVELAAFSKVASERSDCSSFTRGGDLGKFGRGAMQPSFEQAAFELQVGEMSDVVQSQSGFHVIMRTA